LCKQVVNGEIELSVRVVQCKAKGRNAYRVQYLQHWYCIQE